MSAHANRPDRPEDTAQQPPRDRGRPRADSNPIAAPSESPIGVYGNLTPEQTHILARAFIQRMRGINEAEAQKYTLLEPDAVLPAQLHDMHRYLSYFHPKALREIMAEPAVASILDGFAGTEHDRTDAHLESQAPES